VEDEFLPLPSYFDHDLLRRLLFRWAKRFTSFEQIQRDLVERTILEIVAEFPEAADDFAIDVQLLATMRRLALQEFGILFDAPSGRASPEKASNVSEDQ